jgi:hypothetical protein
MEPTPKRSRIDLEELHADLLKQESDTQVQVAFRKLLVEAKEQTTSFFTEAKKLIAECSDLVAKLKQTDKSS